MRCREPLRPTFPFEPGRECWLAKRPSDNGRAAGGTGGCYDALARHCEVEAAYDLIDEAAAAAATARHDPIPGAHLNYYRGPPRKAATQLAGTMMVAEPLEVTRAQVRSTQQNRPATRRTVSTVHPQPTRMAGLP